VDCQHGAWVSFAAQSVIGRPTLEMTRIAAQHRQLGFGTFSSRSIKSKYASSFSF
jgi:hypothetical protein